MKAGLIVVAVLIIALVVFGYRIVGAASAARKPPPLGRVVYLKDGSPWEQALPDGSPHPLAVGGSESGPQAAGILKSGIARPGSSLLSPDGRWQVADRMEWEPFSPTQGRRAKSAGIVRTRAGGSDPTEIYREPDGSGTCTIVQGWSPDSRFVLFWRYKECGAASAQADGLPLRAVAVTGGPPVDISARTLLYRDFFDWSPDGKTLAFVDGGDRSTWYGKRIAVVSLTGAPRILSDPGRSDLFPAWSPDGAWIAYAGAPAVQTDGGDDAKRASGARRIWVMRADGSDQHPLTGDRSYRDEHPEWSADGAFILFARVRGNQAQLWLMRSDGSDPRLVVDGLSLPSPEGWFGYYGYIDWGKLYRWEK